MAARQEARVRPLHHAHLALARVRPAFAGGGGERARGVQIIERVGELRRVGRSSDVGAIDRFASFAEPRREISLPPAGGAEPNTRASATAADSAGKRRRRRATSVGGRCVSSTAGALVRSSSSTTPNEYTSSPSSARACRCTRGRRRPVLEARGRRHRRRHVDVAREADVLRRARRSPSSRMFALLTSRWMMDGFACRAGAARVQVPQRSRRPPRSARARRCRGARRRRRRAAARRRARRPSSAGRRGTARAPAPSRSRRAERGARGGTSSTVTSRWNSVMPCPPAVASSTFTATACPDSSPR